MTLRFWAILSVCGVALGQFSPQRPQGSQFQGRTSQFFGNSFGAQQGPQGRMGFPGFGTGSAGQIPPQILAAILAARGAVTTATDDDDDLGPPMESEKGADEAAIPDTGFYMDVTSFGKRSGDTAEMELAYVKQFRSGCPTPAPLATPPVLGPPRPVGPQPPIGPVKPGRG